MTRKIFRSIITVSMTVLIASLIIASSFLYDYFNKAQIEQLDKELSLVASFVEKQGAEYFNSFASSVYRFTYISADGSVLYDSEVGAEEMENHLDREEISQAIKNGSGSSGRYSSTLTEKTFYKALRLKNGNILRISTNQVTVSALILGMLPAISAIILISGVVALILSHKMANSIVKPLNELNLNNPAYNNTYEELVPILSKIDKQYKQIAEQMRKLRRKSDEFEQITASMNEGLVLLDKNGAVISINAAAKKVFATADFINGDSDLSCAVKNAFEGHHSEFRKEIGGNEYHFLVNRTEFDGKTLGVVILCFDVTEAAFAERNRREFTANVSHELKTPLQSIIGSAELLGNGLVKPEDTDRFIGNIKNEATRLVLLIDDIIRLSQLDEDSKPATESVDLFEVANEVIEVLSTSAEKKQIKLYLNGNSCVIEGIRRYIYEIIYNLCDNAIRYNKDGGKVEINLKNTGGNIVLTVSDTGIGIPKEHHSRIFERFYRVDKSHSKETGGTGLGLSIVKHAVAYHGGTIKLDSNIGEGTTITVSF